eukprot:14691273-Alexandrium_andersonii.AAC.1
MVEALDELLRCCRSVVVDLPGALRGHLGEAEVAVGQRQGQPLLRPVSAVAAVLELPLDLQDVQADRQGPLVLEVAVMGLVRAVPDGTVLAPARRR